MGCMSRVVATCFLTNDMQFTVCMTLKPLFHNLYDPYVSYKLKDTIYNPYQFVYIGQDERFQQTLDKLNETICDEERTNIL